MTRPPTFAVLLLVPLAASGQEVAGCDPAPAVTALIEPWEETTATLAEGALRLAVIEGEEGTRRLLVLTLPPVAARGGEGEAQGEGGPSAPAERRCRVVAGSGLGFADLDLAGLAAEEDAVAGTLTLRLPALGFDPESTELRPFALRLTLGVADDALAAVEEGTEDGAEGQDGAAAP